VKHGFVLITGSSDGIMGAVQRGVDRAHSFALNIRLRSEQRVRETIEDDPKLITLNYFFTRKLSFVKEAHAFALFPAASGRWMKPSRCSR
jgi:predicted Rossmann-fold nucleotide-binding protein